MPPANSSIIEITYYTDPLCAWSWALEPVWRRLRYEYGEQVACQYRMVGLIPSWDRFHDPVHDVSRAAQMAPLWMQISETTGAPLDIRLWLDDPPASSMPACLAVKAAQRQGPWCAEAYLRRLREAAMLLRQNIARREILDEVARQAADDLPPHLCLNIEQWSAAMDDEETTELLLADLRHVRYFEIERFPAIQFQLAEGRPILCVGLRDFSALSAALRHLNPELKPRREVNLPDFAAYWGRLTKYELVQALELDTDSGTNLLRQAAQRGDLANVEILA